MTDEQIIEAWKVAGRLDTVGDNLQQAVAMVRALLADGGKGEHVAWQWRNKVFGTWHFANDIHHAELMRENGHETRALAVAAPQAECAPRAQESAPYGCTFDSLVECERADAEKDAARIDFYDANQCDSDRASNGTYTVWINTDRYGEGFSGGTFREAIDAAILAERKGK